MKKIPNPYPIRRTQTGRIEEGTREQVCIDSKVGAEAIKFQEIMEKLPTEIRDAIWRLPMISGIGQALNIRDAYDNTLTRYGYCIRMSSRTFVITGATYLKKFLNEEIVGLDENQLEYLD